MPRGPSFERPKIPSEIDEFVSDCLDSIRRIGESKSPHMPNLNPVQVQGVDKMMRAYLEGTRHRVIYTASEVAFMFVWAHEQGVLDEWLRTPKSFGQCFIAYTREMKREVEKITSLIYTTRDGKYTVERPYHPATVEREAGALNVCLRDMGKGAGARYAPLLAIPKGRQRAPLELYVIRPTPRDSQQEDERPDPVLVFSYEPATKTIIEIERRAEQDGTQNYLQEDSELLPVFLETLRAMRSGDIADMPVEVVGGLRRVCRPNHVLYDTGAQVHVQDADAHLAVAGGAFELKAVSSVEGARIAETFPLQLSIGPMTSQEHLDALTTIRGSIEDIGRADVRYPNLRSVGLSVSTFSKRFSAPQLESVGFMFSADQSEAVLDVPKLESFFILRRKAGARFLGPVPEKELRRRTMLIVRH